MSPVPSGPLAAAPAGSFRGRVENDARHWLGIRYGQAPVGDRRWRAPQAAVDITDEVDAAALGAARPRSWW